MNKNSMHLHPVFHRRRGYLLAAAACALLLLVPRPAFAQTTYSYGNGTNLPAAQLTGNWNAAGRWYDGTNWGNWGDGSVARFFSPAVGGASVTITNGSDVLMGGLTKQALAGNFTVLAQAGFALNFVNGATISVDGNTLATQGGAVNGTNLVVTSTTNLASTLRFGPGGGEAFANNISGLTLDTITLKLSKNNGVAAVGGNVVVNSGVLEHGAAFNNRRDNQYAAGSTLTLNGGQADVWSTTQTLDSFTYNAGTFTIWANANMNLVGDDALTMRNLSLTRTGGSAGQTYNINLAKNGAQTVRFDAANNGTAVMTEGTALVLGGGVKTFNVENGTATTDMQVLANAISETASSSIRKTGGGVVAWNVSGTTNSYSGGMTVEQGALFFVRQAALPSSGVAVSNGATLGLRMTTGAADAFTEQQFLDLHAGTLSGVTIGATAYAGYETSTTNTLSAALSGTRGLNKLGGGNLTLTGENTYTGGTLINQGNLQIGTGGTAGSITGDVVMASAVDSFRQLIFNRSDNLTYGGTISGSGSLRKEGAGTLTLTGTNSYNNATTVAAGTLAINGNQSAATAAVSVSSGATLAGSGTIGGATTINGRHSPGNSPGVQTFNNGLAYVTGSTFVWDLTANALTGRGTVFDGVDVAGGTLSISTGVASDLVFNAAGSTVSWSDAFWGSNRQWLVFDNASSPTLSSANVFDTINIGFDSFAQSLTSVRAGSSFSWEQIDNDVYLNYTIPEPSTYALLALAAAGLGAHVVRRRTHAGR